MTDTPKNNSTIKSDNPDRTNRLAWLARALNIPKLSEVISAERWMLYSIIVGILTGLGAVLFYFTITLVTEHVLTGFVGLHLPSPGGEPELFTFSDVSFNRWLLLIVPAIGGLLSGLITYKFAPESKGDGTDSVIGAYHNERGFIRSRVPLVKIITSTLTIGTGGSAGREGPVTQIGAGIGSYLADKFKLKDSDRRLLVICGTAAGVGSIFKAPFGGALYSIEVLYKRESEMSGLVPAFISSIVAYSVFCSFLGWGTLFRTSSYVFNKPIELVFYALLGLIMGIVGVIYITTYYAFRDHLFDKINTRPYIKPAIGGLMLGIIAFFMPEVVTAGYGWIQMAIDGDTVTLGIGLMVALIFAKILATSFTVASGGSGGLFAPTIMIGAMTGGAFGQILHELMPHLVTQPTAFVLVGMAAALSGVTKVPITSIVMVSELTGNYNLLVPLMLASTISYITTGQLSIYENQPSSRIDSPAHRRELAVDVLEFVQVEDAMIHNVMTIRPQGSISSLLETVYRFGHTGYPVIEDDKLVGIITFQDASKVEVENRAETTVADVMSTDLITTYKDETLENALRKLLEGNIGRIPVVERDDPEKLIGIITKYDIIKTHAHRSARE